MTDYHHSYLADAWHAGCLGLVALTGALGLAAAVSAGATSRAYVPLVIAPPLRVEGRCEQVYSGDRIAVRVNGQLLTVAYIGVDAPDASECYRQESEDANRALALGRWLILELDLEQTAGKDFAAYAYNEAGQHVGASLLRGGFARLREEPINRRHIEELAGAEAEARTARRGLWGPDCAAYPAPSPYPGPYPY